MAAEIISRVERRRQWSDEEKVRIMGEALCEGASVAAVADRNGVCRSQLYMWLRYAREGRLSGISLGPAKQSRFVPVEISAAREEAAAFPPGSADLATPAPSAPAALPARGRRPATIEVVLTNGRIVRIDETIDPEALARLITVLDDGARLRQDGGRSC